MLVLRSLLFNILFFAWSAGIQVLFLPVLVLPYGAMVWLQHVWGRGTFVLLAAICGLRYQIRGIERMPSQACIIACRHESAWETMIFGLLMKRPSHILKRELLRIPLFGWYLLRAGGIPIDREGGASALKHMIAEARRTVEDGRHIVIFPEGTRVAPGQRIPYHPGVAALYSQLKVSVAPVALNSGQFWGRRTFLKRPGCIVLEFLEPIPPGLPRRDFVAILEQRIGTASARLAEEARGRA